MRFFASFYPPFSSLDCLQSVAAQCDCSIFSIFSTPSPHACASHKGPIFLFLALCENNKQMKKMKQAYLIATLNRFPHLLNMKKMKQAGVYYV